MSVAVLLICKGAAAALEVSDLERCRMIESNSARLACFDAVTARQPFLGILVEDARPVIQRPTGISE